MLILQIIIPDKKWKYMVGVVRQLQSHTIVGKYSYHPYDLDNTLRHFGKFKLELIHD